VTGIYLPVYTVKPGPLCPCEGLRFLVEQTPKGWLHPYISQTLPVNHAAEAHPLLGNLRTGTADVRFRDYISSEMNCAALTS
jgi:hypothetical protein